MTSLYVGGGKCVYIPQIVGYLILLSLGVLLFFIASYAIKRHPIKNINNFVIAGRYISFGFLASSVLVAWTWTTTIMGAAEAGMWYGISGGISYSLGASIPFLLFVPLVLRLKRIMPNAVTYTEFVGERYGRVTKDIYFVFAVLVVLYVFIEQLVGIGLVFNNVFGIPFKITVFTVAMIVTSYITKGGIRGAFHNNVVHFFIICTLLGVIFFYVAKYIDIKMIYEGLIDTATNSGSTNYNPSILMLNSISGFKYGVIAIVVAFGQVLLDQGYYSIAMSSVDRKSLIWGFLVGAVFAWMPISIISANLFGHTAIALKLSPGHGINTTTDIATYILAAYCGPAASIIFAIMIFSIGVSTGGNCLVGLQALFAVDYYSSKLKPDANDDEKIRFGRIITVCIGSLCALIAISLEGISLLKIDMFSGIFFAAPCGALIAGLYSKKVNEKIAVMSIFAGLLSGIGIWVYFGDLNESWFYGCMISLLVPVIIIIVVSFFSKGQFNFAKLRYYKIK